MKKILIVDDNRDFAKALGMVVENIFNEQAAITFNGPSALEKIDSFSPDLIFLDLAMDGMDGFETAQKIRAEYDNRKRHITLVALTGLIGKNYKQRARRVGFDHFLAKTADLNVIHSVVQKLKT